MAEKFFIALELVKLYTFYHMEFYIGKYIITKVMVEKILFEESEALYYYC